MVSGSRSVGQPTTTVPRSPSVSPVAQPVTLLSEDFESGSLADWSEFGGAWRIVADGDNQVPRQGNPTPGLSRLFNGDVNWVDYSLRAKVKPLAFGSPGLVGVTARTSDVSTYYRLALTSDGQAVLQAFAGSTTSPHLPVRQ